VDAPYVAEAYTALECRLTEIIRPRGLDGQETDSFMVFGQVIGIHISEEIIRDGRIDMGLARPIGRMGYRDYADGGSDVFELVRPSG
jgi:flavin reductase (DIM6/NTAB) family NADH-FMN oxidoreductase RutF